MAVQAFGKGFPGLWRSSCLYASRHHPWELATSLAPVELEPDSDPTALCVFVALRGSAACSIDLLNWFATVALSRYEYCQTCHVVAVNCPMRCLEKFIEIQNQLNQISAVAQRRFINPDGDGHPDDDSGAIDKLAATADEAEVKLAAALSSELSRYWETHANTHTSDATGGGKELYRYKHAFQTAAC